MKKAFLKVIMIAASMTLLVGCATKNTNVSKEKTNTSVSTKENVEATKNTDNTSTQHNSEVSTDIMLIDVPGGFKVGNYWFLPEKSAAIDAPLTFVVYDEGGKVVARTCQPMIDEVDYLQGEDFYDWKAETQHVYANNYAFDSADRKVVNITDEIAELTGIKLSERDEDLARIMMEFMQNSLATIPGHFEASYYVDNVFSFALTDLDKNGKRELIVDKGYCGVIYVPNGYWNQSGLYGDVKMVDPDEKILVSIRGDLGGSKTFHLFDEKEDKVLAPSYMWDTEYIEATDESRTTYYECDASGQETGEVSEEEFNKIRYNEVPIGDCDLGWKSLNVKNFFEALYEPYN